MEEDGLNDFGVDDGVAELNGTVVESMEEPSDTTPTLLSSPNQVRYAIKKNRCFLNDVIY